MVEKQRKKSIPTEERERAHGTYEQKYIHKYSEFLFSYNLHQTGKNWENTPSQGYGYFRCENIRATNSKHEKDKTPTLKESGDRSYRFNHSNRNRHVNEPSTATCMILTIENITSPSSAPGNWLYINLLTKDSLVKENWTAIWDSKKFKNSNTSW